MHARTSPDIARPPHGSGALCRGAPGLRSLFRILSACIAFSVLGADGAPPAAEEQIRRLIKELGDLEWRTRERAQEQIIGLGSAAAPALRSALLNADKETASRAREILGIVDPIEAAVTIVRVQFSADGAPWRVVEKAFFRGREGRIASNSGTYLFALEGEDAARASVSLRATTSGMGTPTALDLSRLEHGAWCPVEERAAMRIVQEGVRLEFERTPSVLLLWTTIRKRLDGEGALGPVDVSAPEPAFSAAFAESLLAQLSAHRSLAARLMAGEMLARMGEQRAGAALETLMGEPAADAARARLGHADSIARLAESLAGEAHFPEAEEAALALAERGHETGIRVIAEHLTEFDSRRQDDAVWLLARRLLASPAEIPLRGAAEYLADTLLDAQVPRDTPGRFLLYAMAQHPEAAARLSPLVREALEAASTSTATMALQTSLHAARILLSRGAVPRGELEGLAAVLARHSRGSFWQEAVMAIPYLCEAAGPGASQPFIDEARAALADDKAQYFVKNLLTALAVLVPRDSPQATQLLALLKEALLAKEPPAPVQPAATPGSPAPVPYARRRLVVLEALSFLLRIPLAGENLTAADHMSALVRGEPAPGAPAASPPDDAEYELSIWTLLHRDGTTLVRDEQHFRLRMFSTAYYRDGMGNLRAIALLPPSYYPKHTAVQTIVTGGSRLLRVGEPVVMPQLFPDSTVRTVVRSSEDVYERYESSEETFSRVLLCVRRGADMRGRVSWEAAVADLVATLESPDQNVSRNTIGILSELKLKEAAPALRALFARRPTLDVAESLAEIGDHSGEKLFLTTLRNGPRPEKTRAVMYFLKRDPDHGEAHFALEQLLRTTNDSDLYPLMNPVRMAFAAAEPRRQRLLTTLAGVLTTKNVSPLVHLLRDGTGLDFGYEEAMQSGLTAEERETRLQRIVGAWKEALAPRPTDKQEPNRSRRE